MENVIVLFFLVFGTVWDIKRKTVPVKYLVVWGIVCVIYIGFVGLVSKDIESLKESLWGILPGGIGLFLAYATREQIGYGDGWIILFAGLFLGIKVVLILLFVALTAVTVFSIGLLMMRKAKRKTAIPFIPFLLLGAIIVMMGGGFI